MKKIFLLTIINLVIACGFAVAQIGKGTILAGGTVGMDFKTDKYKDDDGNIDTQGRSTSINFNPRIGYFILDNFAIGGGLGLSLYKWKPDGGGNNYTSRSISLVPFARYYFGNIFGEGTVGFGSGKSETENGNESKYTLRTWSLGVGYAVFLNDNVAVEPKLIYGSSSEKNKDSNVRDISSGLSINVGIQVYLR